MSSNYQLLSTCSSDCSAGPMGRYTLRSFTWGSLCSLDLPLGDLDTFVLGHVDINVSVYSYCQCFLGFHIPVFRIRIILIRIRGSASGMMDPDPGPVLDLESDLKSNKFEFFLLNFFCIRFKTHNDVFCCCNFELIIRVY